MSLNRTILLKLEQINLFFPELDFHALKNIDLEIYEGEIIALVGESGSGKSLTTQCILGIEPNNSTFKGNIKYKNQQLKTSSSKYPPNIRGKEISLIPQDTLSALNPVFTIGEQIDETIKTYQKELSKKQRKELSLKTLNDVGIADSDRVYAAYPHEISGGMRQRAMIAMAIINNPDLIIADEPTTALDVTVQALILKLLKSLNKTILFITHDLGVVAEIADRVAVMQHGEIIELNNIFEIFDNPKENYTKQLLNAIPKLT